MKSLICLSVLVLTLSFNAFADKVITVEEPLSERDKVTSEIFMGGTGVGIWILGEQNVQMDGDHLEKVLKDKEAKPWEVKSAKRTLALSKLFKRIGAATAIFAAGHLAYKAYRLNHANTAEIQEIVPPKRAMESDQHEPLGCSFSNQLCEPVFGVGTGPR